MDFFRSQKILNLYNVFYEYGLELSLAYYSLIIYLPPYFTTLSNNIVLIAFVNQFPYYSKYEIVYTWTGNFFRLKTVNTPDHHHLFVVKSWHTVANYLVVVHSKLNF